MSLSGNGGRLLAKSSKRSIRSCQSLPFKAAMIASSAGGINPSKWANPARGSSSGSLGDRGPHEVAPFGPGTIIVPDAGIAQQIGQYKPGQARAFADPAIGNDVISRLEADLGFVDRPELGDRLERAVLVHGAAPGDILGTRNVAAAQRAFLGIGLHVQELAGKLLGTADIDQGQPRLGVGRDRIAKGANPLFPAALHLVLRGGIARGLCRRGTPLVEPQLAATVQNPAVGMSEELERPECVASPPVR